MKTVFFDIDGTLLDSLESIENALDRARQEIGLPKLSAEEVKAAVGYGVVELIRRTTPAELNKKLESIYTPLLEEQSPAPYPFIEDILEELHQRDYTLIAASNKPVEVAQECLEKAGIIKYFAEVRGVSNRCKPKPHGDLVLLTPGERAVLVGDSDVDVETGLLNSIPVIAVTWGFRSICQLKEAGAEIICTDPEQLVNEIRDAFE